jgi:8-oxo-dGTP pyrophosphatase MutT (NUDIX family)
LEAALKREVREETGIEVEVGEMLTFQEEFYYYDPGDRGYHSLLFFFHCTPKTFNLIDNDQVDDKEASDPAWVAIAGLRAGDFEGYGELILTALSSPP